MDDILIDLGVSALLRVLKNNTQRSKWRRALLKVFKATALAFKNDPDFASVMSGEGS